MFWKWLLFLPFAETFLFSDTCTNDFQCSATLCSCGEQPSCVNAQCICRPRIVILTSSCNNNQECARITCSSGDDPICLNSQCICKRRMGYCTRDDECHTGECDDSHHYCHVASNTCGCMHAPPPHDRWSCFSDRHCSGMHCGHEHHLRYVCHGGICQCMSEIPVPSCGAHQLEGHHHPDHAPEEKCPHSMCTYPYTPTCTGVECACTTMHWILAPEPPVPQVCVPVIDDLLANQEFLAAEHPMTWLRQKLIVNDQQIQQIAALTVGQKDNCLWSTVRKNRLTASNFGCVLAAVRRNRYPASLFKRLCQAYDLSKKDAIIWGVCNERVAIDKYRSYGDAVVEPTGIWLHSNGVLGCSPDGIVRRPAAFGFHHQSPPLIHIMQACNIRPTVLEVKCPYTAKEKTISEAIDTIDDFCLEFQEFCGERTYKLKETHPYYDQIQGQLFITGKQACDFMVWTPKDCAIVRITQDPVWQTNISVLTDFYFHRFIPHLQQ